MRQTKKGVGGKWRTTHVLITFLVAVAKVPTEGRDYFESQFEDTFHYMRRE